MTGSRVRAGSNVHPRLPATVAKQQQWTPTREAPSASREMRRAELLGRGVGVLALLKTKLPNPVPRYAMLNYLSECPRADAKDAATMLAAEQSY